MNELLTLATLTAALRLAVPVAVAALGEVITERSGVLNLGVEGTMLGGAYAGYVVARATGSPWAGLAAGLAAGVVCGAVLALFMVVVRTDQIVTGLAFTLCAGALTTYLFERSYTLGEAPPRVSSLGLPVLVAVTVVVALGVWALLHRTTAGLVLTAAGEDPVSADALGTRVSAVRFAATVGGNALVGLSGALLVCGPLGIFVQNVTAGRGWIALALVVFARWRPVPVVLGALLFGACEAARLRLQNTATAVPYEVFLALPYLVTLLVLIAASRRAHSPAALAIPFVRTHR